MTRKPFKVGDNVRTRDGREARIFMVDGEGPQPIIGAVREKQGYWTAQQWTRDGLYLIDDGAYGWNLIHVPETRTVEGFLVMNKDGSVVFCPSYNAEAEREIETFAVKHITVTFEEGEGL